MIESVALCCCTVEQPSASDTDGPIERLEFMTWISGCGMKFYGRTILLQHWSGIVNRGESLAMVRSGISSKEVSLPSICVV